MPLDSELTKTSFAIETFRCGATAGILYVPLQVLRPSAGSSKSGLFAAFGKFKEPLLGKREISSLHFYGR